MMNDPVFHSRKIKGYPVDISLIGLYNLKHWRIGILNPVS